MLDKLQYFRSTDVGVVAEFADDESEAWQLFARDRGGPQVLIRHVEGGMPLHLSRDGARSLARILEGFAATGRLSRIGD